MATKQTGVQIQHPQYVAMTPIWSKARAAAAGEDAIHAGGTDFLAKLKNEKTADYTNRKTRTPFFNASRRTITGLKGMLFRKDPQEKVPTSMADAMKDIDMAGTPMKVFAQDAEEELLTVGRFGILVDFPVTDTEKELTVAQANAMGLRPMMQKYLAENIINWKEKRIGNVMKLVLVVLTENAALPAEDEFGHVTEAQYRVLDLIATKSGEFTVMAYRQRVYRINAQGSEEQIGKDVYPKMNGALIDTIPFFFLGVDDIGADITRPPLLDLINMNLHHYQVSADYEHGCHWSGLPTLFVTGYKKTEKNPAIYIGGSAANLLPDPTSQAFYAEVSGDFGALRQNLDNKKSEMAILGARMLEEQKESVESEKTQRQRVSGESSQLSAMAQISSMVFEEALAVFLLWAGGTGEIEYQINTDFIPEGMTGEELTAMVGAWQAGAISDQVLFNNLQKGEVIDSETTYEEEQERKASQKPAEPALDEDPDA